MAISKQSKWEIQVVSIVDRKAREQVAFETRRFLNGKSTAFAFDDALWSIESDDPTVVNVVRRLWFHYDDLQDHETHLSRTDWDYFQRLLLILEADRHIETQTTFRWCWSQCLALSMLLAFGFAVFSVGLELNVFWTWLLLFVSTILIAHVRNRIGTLDLERIALHPFSSFSELRDAYRNGNGFRKQTFRSELSKVKIRTSFETIVMWIPTLLIWFGFAPLVLLLQALPKRVELTTVVEPDRLLRKRNF